ncbi:hypothetical protein CGRA01v4_07840 [Colletotrichum graminicola]|nr:hypothetical protein CGRA01v4_07840 [Colletotrichum graminicola]
MARDTRCDPNQQSHDDEICQAFNPCLSARKKPRNGLATSVGPKENQPMVAEPNLTTLKTRTAFAPLHTTTYVVVNLTSTTTIINLVKPSVAPLAACDPSMAMDLSEGIDQTGFSLFWSPSTIHMPWT